MSEHIDNSIEDHLEVIVMFEEIMNVWQKDASKEEFSNTLATSQLKWQVQSTANMSEPTTLQIENQNSNEQLREQIRQFKSTFDNALTLNRRASIAMGST